MFDNIYVNARDVEVYVNARDVEVYVNAGDVEVYVNARDVEVYVNARDVEAVEEDVREIFITMIMYKISKHKCLAAL